MSHSNGTMTLKEMAETYGVPLNTLRHHLDKGNLKSETKGRGHPAQITEAEAKRYMDEVRHRPGPKMIDKPPPINLTNGRYECRGCTQEMSKQHWHQTHKYTCEPYKQLQKETT